jgi:anti-sigma B factor antagonist
MNTERSDLQILDGPEPGMLRLSGDLDSHSCRILAERMDAQGRTRPLTIDLSEIRFMDSSGLRILVADHQARTASDAQLVLKNPSPAVLRLLEITSLTDFLNVVHQT